MIVFRIVQERIRLLSIIRESISCLLLYLAGTGIRLTCFIGIISSPTNGRWKICVLPQPCRLKTPCISFNRRFTWKKVEGAVGYNILWGIAKDKLYQTYQIFSDQPTAKEIRALNKSVIYYFAIEAFNENGVSAMSEVMKIE